MESDTDFDSPRTLFVALCGHFINKTTLSLKLFSLEIWDYT